MTNKLKVCIWFNHNAKEAFDFYKSIFRDIELLDESPMVVNWKLNGYQFMGLNGGDLYQPNEGISLVLECIDQEDLDYYWDKLSSGGGSPGRCGWLKDPFNVSWQIVPANLGELIGNPVNGPRAVQAMLKMDKLIIHELKNA